MRNSESNLILTEIFAYFSSHIIFQIFVYVIVVSISCSLYSYNNLWSKPTPGGFLPTFSLILEPFNVSCGDLFSMTMLTPPASSPVDLEDWETQTELNPRSNVFVPNRAQFPLPSPHMAPTTTMTDERIAQDGFDEWTRTSLEPSVVRATTSGWDQNRQIWEAANTPAPLMYSQDFPSLHDGSNSTFSRRSAGPLPALNHSYASQYSMYTNSNTNSSIQSRTDSSAGPTPKITLLKRPTGSAKGSPNGSRGTTPPAGAGRSLIEREEEYRKARERIFASGAIDSGTKSPRVSGNGNVNHNATEEGNGGSSFIHRQPTGPSANGSSGFGSNSSSRSGSGRGRRRG